MAAQGHTTKRKSSNSMSYLEMEKWQPRANIWTRVRSRFWPSFVPRV